MKSSKKLLSFFLAVVMVVSVLSVMASAYTVGPEVDGNVNYKYTVEKVSTVPATKAGSLEYTADNIYAVTAWLKCNNGVTMMTIPFHFNKAKFSPIMLFDGEVTYPHGAGFSVDNYFAKMGEGTVYAYSLGDYMNNTGMYKANGTAAATPALAKCVGLGNSNSAGIDIITELVSPDHALYSKWGAGLPENTGVLYANLDVTGKTKTAYFNTIDGVEATNDWVKAFTVYFEAITDDVNGAEFGVYTADCHTVDGVTDEYADYFTSATTSVVGNPTKNIVENAVIEANDVYSVGNAQWRENPEVAGTYDIGQKFGFDFSTIGIEFYEENGEGYLKGQSKNVAAVGADVTMNTIPMGNYEHPYVYKVGESYQYRVIIAELALDCTDTFTIKPYVKMKDGGKVYTGKTITINAAEVLAKVPQA